MSNNSLNDSVIISEQEIQASGYNRARQHRVVTQTPAYRAASNLAYFVVEVIMLTPHKLRKPAENLDVLTNDLLRAIAFAYESRSNKFEALTDALAITRVIMTKLNILQKKGYVSKDIFNKSKKLSNNLFAQMAAWRASVNDQCSIV